jgi:ATP-dependent DNA helicase RecG
VMDSFVRGQTQLLVSTVVIEVGIDVPNATVMVLEQAERFGLAQLHQLRGRIGRSTLASVCIAMSDTRGDVATARLEAFVQHQDGFVLAERDLELRGPGETLGTRQSGVHALRFTRLLTDQHIVQHARDEAARAMDQQVLTKHAGDTAHVDQIVQRYHLIDRA